MHGRKMGRIFNVTEGSILQLTRLVSMGRRLEADKLLIGENNTLFESMANKLCELLELEDIIHAILFVGKESPYHALNQAIETTEMLGFIKNSNGMVAIASGVFAMMFITGF